jgi:hypothetical protein
MSADFDIPKTIAYPLRKWYLEIPALCLLLLPRPLMRMKTMQAVYG